MYIVTTWDGEFQGEEFESLDEALKVLKDRSYFEVAVGYGQIWLQAELLGNRPEKPNFGWAIVSKYYID